MVLHYVNTTLQLLTRTELRLRSRRSNKDGDVLKIAKTWILRTVNFMKIGLFFANFIAIFAKNMIFFRYF